MDGRKDERNWKMGIWYLIVRIVVVGLAGAFVVAWHGMAWQGGNKSHLIIYLLSYLATRQPYFFFNF